MILYTSCFGDFDKLYPSADIRYDEYYNPYSGSSEHLSNRLKAKMYKVLNPDDLDVWIDASIEIIDREGFERLFSGDLCVFKHPFNKTISDEIKSCKEAGYLNEVQIEDIKELYKSSNMNVDDTPVYACGMIYRTKKAKEFNRLWWELICLYSYRDQLTFPYALSKFPKLKFNTIDINIYNMNGEANPYFLVNPHN